jgi:hypothetical protein
MPQSDIPTLQLTILTFYGCQSSHIESVAVTEVFNDQVTWDGTVEVFTLNGRPNANRAFAWSYKEGSKTKIAAVLGVPPVVSPQTAVQVAMAATERAS